ncbi:hypothetical protein QAD02_000796 [Eretmocerus hayati]|uniref:Uncharacterized protein n=1 Tax=Eretmocerus hayati TaxID=131215 RepID=A0ACC2NH26_9HYME|nr:hypothetical protein QAD02_000796 [Eretmocerus hayati]
MYFSREFLGQVWMNTDKATGAPYITLITKMFNEASLLVVSGIIKRLSLQTCVAAIKECDAIAGTSRVLQNYNVVPANWRNFYKQQRLSTGEDMGRSSKNDKTDYRTTPEYCLI